MPDIFQSVTRRRVLAGAAIFIILLFGTIISVTPNNLSTSLLFAGRLHPVLVHLPIGFLIIAGILELLSRYQNFGLLDKATFLVLLLSSCVATLTAISGYLLSLTGGYNPDQIFWHKWSGIGIALSSTAAVYLKYFTMHARSQGLHHTYTLLLSLTVLAVFPAGHLGGTLTHGSGYLTEYLPEPVKILLGDSGKSTRTITGIANIDSAVIFTEFVQPIFESRCVECHGESKTKAQLRLDSGEGVSKGSRNGPIFVPGQPNGSEIVRRITLAPHQEDVMPPEGHAPLTVQETELIRWWIATGADFTMKVGEVSDDERPSSVKTVLARLSPPEDAADSDKLAFDVAPPDTGLIYRAREAGVDIRYISQSDPYLRVSLNSLDGTLTAEHFKTILPLAEQIIRLDCSRAVLSDDAVAAIGNLTHLIGLHLELTNITDDNLAELLNLSHLEYLNLYGTEVGDEGLEFLKKLKKLSHVYLWQTNVTESGVKSLQQSLPDVVVNTGSSFGMAEVDSL